MKPDCHVFGTSLKSWLNMPAIELRVEVGLPEGALLN